MDFQLKYPKIGEFCQVEQDIEEGNDVLLSDYVRKHYLSFVLNQVNATFPEKSDNEKQVIAEKVEIWAVRKAAVMSLYRKNLMHFVTEIRQNKTFLDENLPQFSTISTQTEIIEEQIEEEELTLDERIQKLNETLGLGYFSGDESITGTRNFKKRKIKNEKPIMNVPPYLPHNSPSDSQSVSVSDDVEMELQQIFKHETDLFDECEENDIKSIINEIENSKVDRTPEIKIKKPVVAKNDKKKREVSVERQKLKNSIWPYQFYIHKMKLREKLTEIAEKSFQKLEKVKKKFEDLFGSSDENDEDNCDVLLGPYSPSIDQNDEVLQASCKKCIADWVVQFLMVYFNDGKITNKDLFKKLAKFLSNNVLSFNQYPDENFVQEFIDEYFEKHKLVDSEESITQICLDSQ